MITRRCSECGNLFLWYRVEDGLCRECKKEIETRQTKAVAASSLSGTLKMESCPLCGGSAYPGQVKCEYCGTVLAQTQKSQQKLPVSRPKAGLSGDGLGMVLVCIPVAATIFIWVWIARMSPLQNPGRLLFWLSSAAIFCTAVVGGFEAYTAKDARHRPKSILEPVLWFFALGAVWVVGYPSYLAARSRYGFTRLLRTGVVVAVVFALSVLSVGMSIERVKSQARKRVQAEREEVAETIPSPGQKAVAP